MLSSIARILSIPEKNLDGISRGCSNKIWDYKKGAVPEGVLRKFNIVTIVRIANFTTASKDNGGVLDVI
jgi:hypothetical protein